MSILCKMRFAVIIVIVATMANVSNASAQTQLSADQILDRIVAQERELNELMSGYTPLVETYIQNLEPDRELGTRPKGDRYFLGKLELSKGLARNAFFNEKGFAQGLKDNVSSLSTMKYLPNGFAQMAFVDAQFDRSRYNFEFIRREFLGEVRCMVFDVSPKSKTIVGAFLGR